MKVQLEVEVHEDSWHNLMTPELWEQLKSGEWRVLSIGFDTEHGLGSLLLRKDDAPLGEDHFHGLQRLAAGLEQQFKMITDRAIREGAL